MQCVDVFEIIVAKLFSKIFNQEQWVIVLTIMKEKGIMLLKIREILSLKKNCQTQPHKNINNFMEYYFKQLYITISSIICQQNA